MGSKPYVTAAFCVYKKGLAALAGKSIFGGPGGTRTPDLLHAMQAL